MKIEYAQKMWKEVELSRAYIRKPDFDKNNYMFKLIDQLDESHSDAISALLNTINDQGIEAVYCDMFRYKVKGVTLSLPHMSTAERIYLVSYAAVTLEKVIYLHYGMTQLSPNTIRAYMKIFGNSEYINILCDDLDSYNYCVYAREGVSC